MAAKKFPKESGGGWFELSDGSKVQGEEEAAEAQAKLDSGDNTTQTSAEQGSGDDAVQTDDGTGLESLAVDRETGTDGGEKIGDDEDDPRGRTPAAGMTVVDYAESGEPIVEGGVPTMTSGISEADAGVQDPDIGVASSPDATLAAHEASREEWGAGSLAPEDSDGSPADRIKVGQEPIQAPQADDDTND